MKGYTFIGNIRNNGEHPELLEEIKEKLPRWRAHITKPDFRERVLTGVRHKFTADGVVDVNGRVLKPHGLFLACWVHNDDMDMYNAKYMAAMKEDRP